MNYLLISILIGVFFIVSIILGLVLGLHYGQKLSRGETIEKPKLNPVKVIKENIKEGKEEKKNKEEQDKLNEWVDAMENYDGNLVK